MLFSQDFLADSLFFINERKVSFLICEETKKNLASFFVIKRGEKLAMKKGSIELFIKSPENRGMSSELLTDERTQASKVCGGE